VKYFQQRRNKRAVYTNTALKCTQIHNKYIVIYIRERHKADTKLVITSISFPKEVSFEHCSWLTWREGRSASWLGLRLRECVSRVVDKPERFI